MLEQFFKKKKEEDERGRDDEMKAEAGRGRHTNMVLPVGASVIGVVASVSLRVSFSGSLSPDFACCDARSAAAWAWAVLAAPVARLAMMEAICC